LPDRGAEAIVWKVADLVGVLVFRKPHLFERAA
jgi:hypothetical protein